MSALSMLARVIRTTDPENVADLSAYAFDNAEDLAPAFGVRLATYLDAIDACPLDKLAAKLTAQIKKANASGRDDKEAAMRNAADAMGAAVTFADGAPVINLRPFLHAIVAGPDSLAFPHFGICVSLDMLRRFRAQRTNPRMIGWTAWVDVDGIHIRWLGGGLNLRASRIYSDNAMKDMVVCNFPAAKAVAA